MCGVACTRLGGLKEENMSKFKKLMFVTAAALAFLAAASLTAYLLGFIKISNTDYGWIFLAAGVLLLIASGIAAFKVRTVSGVNIACFAANAVALGLCIRAWYILRGLENNFLTMLLICLACIACLWIFFLIGLIPSVARHVKLYFWIFSGASFAAYILVIIFTETSFVSTFGYYMLVVAAFIYAMCAEVADLKGLMRSLTLSTYSVFAVAVIAAVVVLTGEGDFSFDFSPDVSSNKRKKKP